MPTEETNGASATHQCVEPKSPEPPTPSCVHANRRGTARVFGDAPPRHGIDRAIPHSRPPAGAHTPPRLLRNDDGQVLDPCHHSSCPRDRALGKRGLLSSATSRDPRQIDAPLIQPERASHTAAPTPE